MLMVSEDERTRFCYDLCILTITLTEHYVSCMKSLEFVYDTMCTNLQIATTPIFINHCSYKVGLTTGDHFVQNSAYHSLLKDWADVDAGSNTQPLKQFLQITKAFLSKSITITKVYKQMKRNFFLKFGKVMDDGNSSSFNELRRFFNIFASSGNTTIVGEINQIKQILKVYIEYEISKGEVQRIYFRDFMPNVTAYLYNILIVIDQVKSFLNSLPALDVSDPEKESIDLTRFDIIKTLKIYLTYLNNITEKTDDLIKYSLDQNYLKRIYSNNFINQELHNFNNKHKYKPLTLSNIGKLKFKNHINYMKILSNNNNGGSNGSENGRNEEPCKHIFPSFEDFILSTRLLRNWNCWYLFSIIHLLGFNFSDSSSSPLATVDNLIREKVSAHFLDHKNPKTENDGPLDSSIPQFHRIIKYLQLPNSYSVLLLIFNFEAITDLLIALHNEILSELNVNLQELDTGDLDEAIFSSIDDFSVAGNALASTFGQAGQVLTNNKGSDIPKHIPKSKVIIDKKIDIIIKNLNLLTDCRSLFLKELLNKKILVTEFFDQLEEIDKAMSGNDNKHKKYKIHKYTKREEKIIISLFLSQIGSYLQVLEKVIYDFLIFMLPEEKDEFDDKVQSLAKLHVLTPSDGGITSSYDTLLEHHHKDLRLKFISVYLTKLVFTTNNIKSMLNNNPKLGEKKNDDVLDELLISCNNYIDSLMRALGYIV
ncbi:hypothetical protein DASC09_001580 [Saccharomycopsis crataegensis]|uniref:Uncharacterized protein n=1 Tax=Saccharomycopsis crataegensis TaxID=43959 RepID=A0AAV5QF64_9ASCO|nr:hypothetical protein DASC09_001580 [Saccharomycopsis crataegensis]